MSGFRTYDMQSTASGPLDAVAVASVAAAVCPTEISLTRICLPYQPENMSEPWKVTGVACSCPTRQTKTFGPVLWSTGRAENATRLPSAENWGSRPTTS